MLDSNWLSTSLGEIIELKRGYDLPQSQRESGTVPVVSSSGISGNHSIAVVKAPGVVTGRYGTIGQVFFITEDFWPLNTTLYVRDFKGNDPRFISYFLRTIDFFSCSDKAAVPGVNRNHLHQLPVTIPDVATQQAIAHILGTLDDKIELNRKMNETLEAMARAIFKSWFIDFAPVRAKSEGRQPEGMDGETAALFPSSFEESSLGKIPKGWSISSIEELATRVGMGPFGSNIKVSTFVDSGVPVISGQHLKQTLLDDTEFNYILKEHAEKLSNSKVYRGDVIFTHAGNIGQVSYIPDYSEYEEYILSQRQFYLRCNNDRISPIFATYFFQSDIGQHKLLANASQVGVPSISRPVSYLKSIELVVPVMKLMSRFDEIVRPLHHLISSKRLETKQLVDLRDTLLLKLVSGEIQVHQAERELEAAR